MSKRYQISTKNVHMWIQYKCMWQRQWLEIRCIMHSNASIANQSYCIDTLTSGTDGKPLTQPLLYIYHMRAWNKSNDGTTKETYPHVHVHTIECKILCNACWCWFSSTNSIHIRSKWKIFWPCFIIRSQCRAKHDYLVMPCSFRSWCWLILRCICVMYNPKQSLCNIFGFVASHAWHLI